MKTTFGRLKRGQQFTARHGETYVKIAPTDVGEGAVRNAVFLKDSSGRPAEENCALVRFDDTREVEIAAWSDVTHGFDAKNMRFVD